MNITTLPSSTPPPIESFTESFDIPAPPGMFWTTLRWRSYDGKERRKPLFLEELGTNRILQFIFSPNGRYYYQAGVQRSDLVKVGQPKMQKVFDELHYCLFSPDSRLLCGYSQVDGAFRTAECATGRVRTLLTQRHPVSAESYYFYMFGWYPDSTHIWYREDFPRADRSATPKHFYKLNVHTLQRQRISEAERKRLFEDWTMLDPRFRFGWVGMDGKRVFVYSLNQRWRVCVEPLRSPFEGAVVEEELYNMYLESRSGSVRLLLSRKDHTYTDIVPFDVTDDGRWVLFAGHAREPARSLGIEQDTLYAEIVVVDTHTLRRYKYYDTREFGAYTPPTYDPNPYNGVQFWFSRVWSIATGVR